MKRLIPKSNHDQYTADVERIVRVCEEHGYVISCAEAKAAWAKFSADWNNVWLILPHKDHLIVEYLLRVCSIEEL